MEDGDFGGEGGGTGTRFSMGAGAGVVGGRGGGWTVGGSLCCIKRFTLKRIESLKDLRDDSRVFSSANWFPCVQQETFSL